MFISWNSRKKGFTPDMFSSVAVKRDGAEWKIYNNGKLVIPHTPRETSSKKQHLYVNVDMRVGDDVMQGRVMSLASIIWLRYLCRAIAPGCVIDHIDDNPLNNKPRNLQMLTIADNVRKSWKKK